MPGKRRRIVKIPIECELPLYLLNQEKVINTANLSRSNQTTLGILAKNHNALRFERRRKHREGKNVIESKCVLLGPELVVIYKTRKKLAIELPPQ